MAKKLIKTEHINTIEKDVFSIKNNVFHLPVRLTKVNYYMSEALNLSFTLLQNSIPIYRGLNSSEMIEVAIETLYWIGRKHKVITENNTIKKNNISKLKFIDLYLMDGSLYKGYSIDGNIISPEKDPRLKRLEQTSAKISTEAKQMLRLLKEAYEINSDAEAIQHIVILKAAMAHEYIEHRFTPITSKEFSSISDSDEYHRFYMGK